MVTILQEKMMLEPDPRDPLPSSPRTAMSRFTGILVALALVLLPGTVSCSVAGSPEADAPQAGASGSHRLAVGDTATVEGMTLRFLGVEADNRCPVGANCFVAGRAVVQLEVVASRGSEDPQRQVVDVPPGGGEEVIGGTRLRLDIEPGAHLERRIEPSEYVLVIDSV